MASDKSKSLEKRKSHDVLKDFFSSEEKRRALVKKAKKGSDLVSAEKPLLPVLPKKKKISYL